MSDLHVVLAGGGTAGHIEPALALADALVRLAPGHRGHRAGHRAGPGDPAGPGPRLPARADPAGAAAAQADPGPAPGARSGWPGRSGPPAPCSTAPAPTCWSASAGTSRCPATSPPAGGASPIVVHEQNAAPGLANRIGARLTTHVAASHPRAGAAARGRTSGSRCARRSPASTAPPSASAARAAFGLLRGRPGAAGHRRLAGRAQRQHRRARRRPGAGRGGDPGAARDRAHPPRGRHRRPAPGRPGRALRRGGLPRRHRARLRRGRPRAVPLRGRAPSPSSPPSGCPRCTCRCRSATASSGSTPSRWWPPAAGSLVADADLDAAAARGYGAAAAARPAAAGGRWRPRRPASDGRDADVALAPGWCSTWRSGRRRTRRGQRRDRRAGAGPHHRRGPRPGALRRDRRRRHERHRPHHARPRRRPSPAPTPRTRARWPPCGRSAPGSRSATTRRTSATPRPWWCPPRSGPDNPELVAARERGLRVLPRAAALAAVMAGRTAASPSPARTARPSTTSMLTVALQHCGADPSFAIGGDLNEAGSNAHHGSGEVFVAEADESDGSFLLLSPTVGLVTNVEADHLDHYADLAAVEEAFVRLRATGSPRTGSWWPARTTRARPRSPRPRAHRGRGRAHLRRVRRRGPAAGGPGARAPRAHLRPGRRRAARSAR